MKAVILAGGFGTRLSEETDLRPKPMVEIGEMPILWHVMKHFSHFGINDFVICLGYKGYLIKEYFANYFVRHSNITIDLGNNQLSVHSSKAEDWRVTLVDTGLNTMTGGRIKRIEEFVDGQSFMLTYGDGVADVDLRRLLQFHQESGKIATVTAVQQGSRFGLLNISSHKLVSEFQEKPFESGAWINGGYFVLEPKVFSYIAGDEIMWEREPLENLARDQQLAAFEHRGFWHAMDTLRDRRHLEKLWMEKNAPWKIWT